MIKGYYYSSRCKVCNSPHLLEYHKLFLLEKYSYEKLSEYAKTLGEDISRESFRNHFTKHVLPYIKAVSQVEAGKFTSEFIREKLREEQNIISSIQHKLQQLETLIDSLMKDPDVKSGDPVKLKTLKDLMAEVRLTQESYLRIRKQYLKETLSDKDKMYEDFKHAIEGCCPSCIEKIIKKLQEMGYE